MKRVILIVLDSVGIGEMKDASKYGDAGCDTLGHVNDYCKGLKIPELKRLGIANVSSIQKTEKQEDIIGSFGKASEASVGKDTVTGHWEMAGVILKEPLNTFPNGFPKEIIDEFLNKTNLKGVLGNIVASGTEIIKDLGEEHIKTGYPIIYTSADSVFQIAAHEDVIPLEKLYEICSIARGILVGDKTVGRVIARPFIGEAPNFKRTSNRHDYALDPFNKTMLEYIKDEGLEVSCVGKIEDVYNKKGVTTAIHTKNNMDGVDKTLEYIEQVENGLIFTNLVDFDMLYGHRNDPLGYGKALEEFDARLPEIYSKLKDEDLLIITADHGCDPTTKGTDHSREYIPVLLYGKNINKGIDIGVRKTFSDIGKSILDYLEVENDLSGESFIQLVKKE